MKEKKILTLNQVKSIPLVSNNRQINNQLSNNKLNLYLIKKNINIRNIQNNIIATKKKNYFGHFNYQDQVIKYRKNNHIPIDKKQLQYNQHYDNSFILYSTLLVSRQNFRRRRRMLLFYKSQDTSKPKKSQQNQQLCKKDIKNCRTIFQKIFKVHKKNKFIDKFKEKYVINNKDSEEVDEDHLRNTIKDTHCPYRNNKREYEEIIKIKGHRSSINSVAYSADGIYLVTGSADRTCRIWNTEKGYEIINKIKGHTSYITSFAYSTDSKYLATGS
ncbi:hypothetical protein ABPG72_013062 [Tetrahymena utriculariae]